MSEQWWENAPESDNRFNPAHPDFIPPFYINTDWDGSLNDVGTGTTQQRQQQFLEKYNIDIMKTPFHIGYGAFRQIPSGVNQGNTIYPMTDGILEPEPVVYSWTSNTQQMLKASNASTIEAQFGGSVAIGGTYAIVGAYKEPTPSERAGAAYVFERDTDGSWNQVPTILRASDAEKYDDFGISVAISGDYAIVGAYGEDTGAGTGYNAGAAYIFERDNGVWGISVDSTTCNETTILKASNAELGDLFGNSVSIDGTYAIIGAKYEDTTYPVSGAAYIFEREPTDGSWNQVPTILKASTPMTYSYFGQSVSISGTYAIVGTNYATNYPNNGGVAYIFERDTDGSWNQVPTILKASNAGGAEYFGNSVAISGDYAIVGAYLEDTSGTDSGAAYIFERVNGVWGTSVNSTTCNETKILKASNVGTGTTEEFGKSVSISGTYAMVGAPKEDTTYGNSGAAYVFERDTDGSWNQISPILKANNANTGTSFGNSVSISGNYTIVGSYFEGTGGWGSGAAYFIEPGIL